MNFTLHLRRQVVPILLEILNLLLQSSNSTAHRIHLASLVRHRRLRPPSPSGPLNLFEQIIPASLELLIEESDVLRGAFVEIFVAYGLRLDLSKAVKVQLARERAELVVVEVLGNYLGREKIGVLDHEHFPVRGPGANVGVACFDHAIGLLEKNGDSVGAVGATILISGIRRMIASSGRLRLADSIVVAVRLGTFGHDEEGGIG